MARDFRKRKALLFIALTILVVYASVGGITWAGWLARVDNFYYDLWHLLADVRYQPQHTVIVALDEATLKAHPDEPLVSWTPHFARVIQVLRRVGARVVGLDYLFQISIESWLKTLDLPANHPGLTYDHPFKEQLSSGQVVMAAVRDLDEQNKRKINLPIPSYLSLLPQPRQDVGLLNFLNDADGVIRGYVPVLADDYGQVHLTFAQLLASRATSENPAEAIERLLRSPDQPDWSAEVPTSVDIFPLIGYVGPPDTFPRISMQEVLDPAAEHQPEIQALKDKVVIIATEPMPQDYHPTPYSLNLGGWLGHEDMSGPEIHANIVETVLTGIFPRPVPGHFRAAYLFVVLLVAAAVVYRLSPWWGLAAVVFFCAMAAGLAYVLFRHYWLLPPANVQVAVILSYLGLQSMKLTGEERERARLRKIFSRYVSDEVVEKLLDSGKHPDLGGESYQVTVLFSDIRNFTTLSESLEPGQVVEMLNTYFSRACEPILAQGGTVDKFIGDAVMAVFGAPVAYPDHTRRALIAALGLARQARAFQTWMQERHGDRELPLFAIGVGLHTGEAIVGNIGSPKRLEYTSIGDTVNVASRLESLTKELGWTIAASQSTVNETAGVVTGRRETRMVRGRKEPLEVFEVLGLDIMNDQASPSVIGGSDQNSSCNKG